jgi:hypothetical protein
MVSISAFFNTYHVYAQGLGGVSSDSWGVNLPKDAARREANRADNKRWQAQWQWQWQWWQLRSVARAVPRVRRRVK